jgi:hypothetical protein
MSLTQSTRPAARRSASPVTAVVVLVGLVAVGLLGYDVLPSSARSPLAIFGVDGHAGVDEADGVVPDGTTVFDDEYPAVAKLDPALLAALREAATAAGDDGVRLYVNSGWRSPEYQQQLLDDAVADYGSEAEAARWVATPDTSPHVSGDAVDIGGPGAADWLSAHGAAYDLCRVYANEPWHFELRDGAADTGCPALYADPTEDPRLAQ